MTKLLPLRVDPKSQDWLTLCALSLERHSAMAGRGGWPMTEFFASR